MAKFIEVPYVIIAQTRAPDCPYCGCPDPKFDPPALCEGSYFPWTCGVCKKIYRCNVELLVEDSYDGELGYFTDSDAHMLITPEKIQGRCFDRDCNVTDEVFGPAGKKMSDMRHETAVIIQNVIANFKKHNGDEVVASNRFSKSDLSSKYSHLSEIWRGASNWFNDTGLFVADLTENESEQDFVTFELKVRFESDFARSIYF